MAVAEKRRGDRRPPVPPKPDPQQPLQDAVRSGRLDAVRQLLDAGADPDERSQIGQLEDQTFSVGGPLMEAVNIRRIDIAGDPPVHLVAAGGFPADRSTVGPVVKAETFKATAPPPRTHVFRLPLSALRPLSSRLDLRQRATAARAVGVPTTLGPRRGQSPRARRGRRAAG